MLKSKNKDNWKGFAPRTAPLTRTRRLNVKGKSTRSVERQRWQAEMLFLWADVDYCEWIDGCNSTFGLANAHRLKKVEITTREEWVNGRAKLCQAHHDWVEYGDRENPGTHERMWKLVNDCMEAAGRFVPKQV